MVSIIGTGVVLHSFLGILALMGATIIAFAVMNVNYQSLFKLKMWAIVTTIVTLVLNFLGDILYVIYRDPAPTSARSILKAGSTPWVHSIGMEFKEHAAQFVPVILVVITFIIFYYNQDIIKNKEIKKIVRNLSLVSIIIILIVFALGTFITQVQPIA